MSARLPLADYQFISDFAAFCRTKGDEGYNYVDCEHCALGQFLRESGRCANPSVSGYGKWHDLNAEDLWTLHQAPVLIDGDEDRNVLSYGDRTFSALADAPALVGEPG